MGLATARQKKKLKELGIEFDNETTLAEAAVVLRENIKYEWKIILRLNENCMAECSDIGRPPSKEGMD